jgi:hypothetical protein
MTSSNLGQLRSCIEKHIIPDYLKEKDNQHLAAAFYQSKLWDPNSTIKIKFLDENPNVQRTSENNMSTKNGPIDPLQQYFFDNPNINIIEGVKKIVNERIQPLVSLKFQFVDKNSDADVRISFDASGGAWSELGTDAKNVAAHKATMNLGWFDVSTVMHEFGHVLGMIHEHQNPSGQTIDWNDQKVYAWANETQGWNKDMTDKNILNKYSKTQVNGSSFDPLSIMLYFFPGDLTNNGIGTNQNLRLSGLDMKFINKKYSKSNANTFFPSIYNSSLESNIDKSKQMLTKLYGNNPSSSKNKLLLILGIIILIFIGLILIKYLKRKYK